jgi:hypothetical protein
LPHPASHIFVNHWLLGLLFVNKLGSRLSVMHDSTTANASQIDYQSLQCLVSRLCWFEDEALYNPTATPAVDDSSSSTNSKYRTIRMWTDRLNEIRNNEWGHATSASNSLTEESCDEAFDLVCQLLCSLNSIPHSTFVVPDFKQRMEQWRSEYESHQDDIDQWLPIAKNLQAEHKKLIESLYDEVHDEHKQTRARMQSFHNTLSDELSSLTEHIHQIKSAVAGPSTMWAFSTALQNHAESTFVGREWLAQYLFAVESGHTSGNSHIDQDIKSNSPECRSSQSVKVVTANPGFGKTTFVKHLVLYSCHHLHGISPPASSPHTSPFCVPIIGYHFCDASAYSNGSAAAGTTSIHTGVFVQSIAAMIAASASRYPLLTPFADRYRKELRTELKAADSLERCVGAFQQYVLQPLHELESRDCGDLPESLFIIVDSLDESRKLTAADYSIGNLLCSCISQFPNWLQVVCTSRAGVVRHLQRSHRNHIDEISVDIDSKETTSDISEYTQMRLNQLSKQGIEISDNDQIESLRTEIVSRADGIMLFVRHLFDYWLDRASRASLSLCVVDLEHDIPKSLDEAYSIFLDADLPAEDKAGRMHGMTILALVCITSVALDKDQVIALISATPDGRMDTSCGDTASRVLCHLLARSYVYKHPNGGIHVFHGSFSEWFLSIGPYAGYLTQAHTRLACAMMECAMREAQEAHNKYLNSCGYSSSNNSDSSSSDDDDHTLDNILTLSCQSDQKHKTDLSFADFMNGCDELEVRARLTSDDACSVSPSSKCLSIVTKFLEYSGISDVNSAKAVALLVSGMHHVVAFKNSSAGVEFARAEKCAHLLWIFPVPANMPNHQLLVCHSTLFVCVGFSANRHVGETGMTWGGGGG